jgi:hypothetical protein
MNRPSRPSGLGAMARALRRACWIGLALIAGFGAGPPDLVRVRVPASKVSAWFPEGSNLQVLPADQFEELVRSVGDRKPGSRGPRILRARHSARWESGILLGRSELEVERPGGEAPALLLLEPWSPALPPLGAGTSLARATEDGRLGIKLVPDGPSSVPIDWELRARQGSGGKAFSLALPELEISSLSLDLPSELIPEGNSGTWIGPEPGPVKGHSTWRLPAASGRVALRFRDRSEEGQATGSPRLWLEGPTRIDLNASPANWRADWTLDESPGAPRRLTIELDPGLELIDVAGPKVASFRVEPGLTPSRVVIRLEGDGQGASPLTIRAITHAPAEGTWPIPSARPIDAVWTGGRTTVRLDPGRVLQTCSEKSGRRVALRTGESPPIPLLVFEPDGGPGPLAELTFRRPTADATVLVRGHLRVDDDSPRIEVALSWTVEKGRLLNHAADLPPGWTPERVVSGSGESVAWHADLLSSGAFRVQMSPPALDGEARSLTMTLVASLRNAGGSGPIDLPRVRPSPSSGRIVDELWVATTSPGLTLRPIHGRGLAWVDPPDSTRDLKPAPWAIEDLGGALAWRWLVDDAEARVDRARVREVPRADVRLDASVIRGRLQLDWTLAIDRLDRRTQSIPILLSEPVGESLRWKVAEPNGGTLEARPLEEPRGTSPEPPRVGTAMELALPTPRQGRLVLKAHADLPWSGNGRLPLLTLPGTYRTRGLIAIRVEDTVRLRVDQAGLTPVDLSGSAHDGSEAADDQAREGELSNRRMVMFSYSDPRGRLGIETTPGQVGPTGGVIREACLTTQVHPGVGLRNRLTLRVATDTARDLVLTMPEGVAIDRIRRDGQTVVASPEGRSFRVAIPSTGPGRGLTRLTLDYQGGPPPSSDLDPSAILPACSLPCLSFVWEVIKPDPWSIRNSTVSLMDTDPVPDRSWVHALLGFRLDPWDFLARRARPDQREAILGELDKIASGLPEGDMSLGDWLVKLDSGGFPMVIDRLALLSAGLGPASRVNVDPGSGKAMGTVDATLLTMGLVATPMDGVILISGKADSPDRLHDRRSTLAAWSAQLRLASSTGSDESDRFQSASRWRGEATPRALVAGESLERFPSTQSWRTRRFIGTGWPPPGASVSLVDERSEASRGWLVTAIILAIGLLARRRPSRSRALGIGLALAVTSGAMAWGWPDPASWVTGTLRGLLAVLALWLGRSFRADGTRPSTLTGGASIASRSSLTARVATVLIVFATIGLRSIPTSAGLDEGSPILALFPFEGPPDPLARPARVVMLLDDYDRLRRLARPDPPALANRVLLIASTYRVSREEPGFALLESRFDVEVVGPGPVAWNFPAGLARDLSATVDARPTPLTFAKEGLIATLPITGPGVHSIRVRGSVPLVAVGQGGERFRVPIVRSAFARVEVAPDARGHWVEVPEAVGRVELQAGGIHGTIGPVDALEVRWFATDRPQFGGPRGQVEAMILWDARPVGDLMRVRLSHSEPEGASTLRLAMEPGLLIRGYSIPDLVGIRREGTVDRPEWVAQIDPPWPRDLPIEVDLWRPRVPGSGARRLPRVETLEARRFSGVIGFRRPGDWSGRLEAGVGVDPLPESSFVKAWGTLPGDGLTLAGSVRFNSAPDLGVVTGPLPPSRVVRPRVLVEVEPGRLKASIEATLSDRQGRSFEIEMGIPTDFRVVRVDSVGMVDWQRVARDRLRIQFDGSEAADRLIQVQGYLPVPADPVMVETRSYQARIPWPRWSDALVEAGTLVVSGQVRFQIEPGEGVSPLPTTGPVESSPAAFRTTYRVEKPGGLGRIQWASPRSKVGVSVRSDLTIDASHVTWTAVVECDVTGGPAESLLWNLPTEWARAAELEIDGHPIRPSVEARGEVTSWKIQPDSPIWRQSRLVIRSRIPLSPGVAFEFPEISPMAVAGRGSVGRYDLAIANVSGHPMEVAGTAGLQAIDVSQYRSDESPAPSGSIGRAYRVTGERWALKITVGGDRGLADADHPERTKVARARLRGSLNPLGEVIGLATYDLKPHPGPYLALKLSEAVDLPWASVDGSPAPVIRDGPGRWLVVLRDRNARRVDVTWNNSQRPGILRASSGSLEWPSTDQDEVPTLLRWNAPRSIEIRSPEAGLKFVPDREWEVEEAEQLAQHIAGALSDFNRGSRRQRGEILRDIVDFELKERSILRFKEVARTAPEVDEARLQSARNVITEASQLAGMDDLVQEARAIAGLGSLPPDQAAEDRTDTAEPIRIRQVGPSYGFQGEGSGPSKSSPISWTLKSIGPTWRRPWPWVVGSIGLLIAGGSALIVARPIRGLRRSALAALLPIGLILLAVEPLGMGLALTIAGLGRLVN